MSAFRILEGDVRTRLDELEPGSVHCCVTSPPYWILRDYGVPGQIGLEKTPEKYVAVLVDVFERVRRVLRDDGTLWLNLGDTYAAGGKGGGGSFMDRRRDTAWNRKAAINGWRSPPPGMKDKDLLGMPWRVAFALQAAGWYLRTDIIWEKPNCTPEAAVDRPTRSHEYIFLLSKKKRYFYDRDAVLEPVTGTARPRVGAGKKRGKSAQAGGGVKANASFNAAMTGLVEARNRRSVWRVRTVRSPTATHYATFPERLILPCILAGTSAEGVCPACGAPWRRLVEKVRMVDGVPFERLPGPMWGKKGDRQKTALPNGVGHDRITTGVKTLGWAPGCKCEGTAPPVPATVLDPFAGSGTTLVAAVRLGRCAIGIELNPGDVAQASRRVDEAQPFLFRSEAQFTAGGAA